MISRSSATSAALDFGDDVFRWTAEGPERSKSAVRAVRVLAQTEIHIVETPHTCICRQTDMPIFAHLS
jgi:hypothetical protein